MVTAMRKLRRLATGATLALAAMALAPSAQAAGPSLDPEAAEVVERVEEYIAGIDTLHARFLQSSSNGGMAEGEVWLDRPGKARFEYDDPHPVLMVSNGRTLLYFDRDLQQTTYLPTRETPLWFLLREDVNMADVEDYHVAQVEEGAQVGEGERTLQVHIVREGVQPGDPGSIELTFAQDPLELKEWRIVDEQGIVSDIVLTQKNYGAEIDPKTFDFTEIELPRRVGPGRDGTGP